jgi:hypothetical protein
LETPTDNDKGYLKTFPNRELEAKERQASRPGRFVPEGKALVYPLDGKFGNRTVHKTGRRVAKKRIISGPAHESVPVLLPAPPTAH